MKSGDALATLVPEQAKEICRVLGRANKRGWVVGGCVRDLLREKPVADWDICTDALPDELTRLFPRTIPTGIEHGTVTVMMGKTPYEVTTLRGEGAYTDGRRPGSVQFLTDIDADLARRDFTVNAIALDPLTGALADPFDGAGDLAKKVIRAVGNPVDRFSEDGLRVLRAARFVSTLEATLDPATERAIAQTLDTFRKVSPERVRDEWVKTMRAKRPSASFEVMRTTGILGVTCPELLEGVGMEQNKWHAFDVWGHAMGCLDACEGDAFLRIAALLHDVGKPRTRAMSDKTDDYTFYNHESVGARLCEGLLTRLRVSNDERARIADLVRHHLICYDDTWTDAAVRRWIRRVGEGLTVDLWALARADAYGKGRPVDDELAKIERLSARVREVFEAGQALTVRALAVNGNDLMRELGMKPGRQLGETLEALLQAVLDDPSANERERLLMLARELVAARA